jgi:hypothetical protein
MQTGSEKLLTPENFTCCKTTLSILTLYKRINKL